MSLKLELEFNYNKLKFKTNQTNAITIVREFQIQLKSFCEHMESPGGQCDCMKTKVKKSLIQSETQLNKVCSGFFAVVIKCKQRDYDTDNRRAGTSNSSSVKSPTWS